MYTHARAHRQTDRRTHTHTQRESENGVEGTSTQMLHHSDGKCDMKGKLVQSNCISSGVRPLADRIHQCSLYAAAAAADADGKGS